MSNPLTRLRTDPTLHWVGLVACLLIGLVLATIHWVGLVAGGALVGLMATSLPRGLLAGFGFGVVVVLVWSFSFLLAGTLGKVMAMGEFALLGVVLALALSTVGSLARGLI